MYRTVLHISGCCLLISALWILISAEDCLWKNTCASELNSFWLLGLGQNGGLRTDSNTYKRSHINSQARRRALCQGILKFIEKWLKNQTILVEFSPLCKLSISQNKGVLAVNTHLCNQLPSLKRFITCALPSLDLYKASHQLVDPNGYYFSSMRIKDRKILIVAVGKEVTKVIDDYLSLHDTKLTLTFPLDFKVDIFLNTAVNLAGLLSISKKDKVVRLWKRSGSKFVRIYINVSFITFHDLAEKFVKEEDALLPESLFQRETFKTLRLTRPVISGVLLPRETFEIVVQVKSNDSYYFPGCSFIFWIVKERRSSPKAALEVEVPKQYILKDLLRNVFYQSFDDKRFKLLDDLRRKYSISIAKRNVAVEHLGLYRHDTLYLHRSLSQGTIIKCHVGYRDTVRKLCPQLKHDDVPNELPLRIKISDNEKLNFDIFLPRNFNKAIKCLIKSVDRTAGMHKPITSLLSCEDKVTVKTISVGRGSHVKVVLEIINLVIGKNSSIPSFVFNITVSKGSKNESRRHWVPCAGSNMTFREQIANVQLVKEKGDAVFILRFQPLPFSAVMSILGNDTIPPALIKVFSDFWVKDFRLEVPRGPGVRRFDGSTTLLGYQDVRLRSSFHFSMDSEVNDFRLALQWKKASLARLMNRLMDFGLEDSNWFKMSSLTLVYNGKKQTDMSLQSTEVMKQVGKIDKETETHVITWSRLPQPCLGDAVCHFIKKNVANVSEIRVRGRITENFVILRGHLAQRIDLIKTKFSCLETKLNVRLQQEHLVVYLTATVKFTFNASDGVRSIYLKGHLFTSLSGKLQLEFKGLASALDPYWENLMRTKTIAMHETFDLAVGAHDLDLEVIVEIHLSSTHMKDGLEVSGFLRITLGPEDEVYFMAVLKELAMWDLARLVIGNTTESPALKDMEFLNDAVLCYCRSRKAIEIGPTTYFFEPGLSIHSEMRILESNVNAIVRISKTEILITAYFPVLFLANGLVEIQRSKANLTEGPVMQVSIRSQSIKAVLSGYVIVFGIGTNLHIRVLPNGYGFAVDGQLFLLFPVQLAFQAKDRNLVNTDFKFVAEVKDCKAVNDEVIQLYLKLKTRVANISAKAKDVLSKALFLVDTLSSQFKNTTDNAVAKQNMPAEADRETVSADFVQENSCNALCSVACFPALQRKQKCFILDGKVFRCLTWNACRWLMKDPLCIASCEIEKIAEKYAHVATEPKVMSQEVNARSKVEFVSPMDDMMLTAKDLVQKATRVMSDLDNASLLEIITGHGNNLKNNSNNHVEVKAIQLSGTLGFTYNGCMNAWIFCQVTDVGFNFNTTVCTRDGIVESLAAAIILNQYKQVYWAEENLANIQATLNEIDLQRLTTIKKARELMNQDQPEAAKQTQHSHESSAEFNEAHSVNQEPMMEETLSLYQLEYESPWTLFDPEIYGANHNGKDEEIRSPVVDYKETHFVNTNPCVELQHVVIKYRTIMKSIGNLFKESRKVNSMFANTTSAIAESLKKIKQLVEKTDNSVTDQADRGLLYLWYHEVKTGFQKWVAKTESAIFENYQRKADDVLAALGSIFKPLRDESLRSYKYLAEKKIQVGNVIGLDNIRDQVVKRINLVSMEISRLLKEALFHPNTMFSAIEMIGKELELIQDYVDECSYGLV